MSQHDKNNILYTRRDFLNRCGMGFGALGLGATLGPNAMGTGGEAITTLTERAPHFAAKAKRVIHIFANGGPSQVDTFDPKPMLTKWHGRKLPTKLKTERVTGAAMASPFKFKRYGANGIEVSELFPHVGECIDDMNDPLRFSGKVRGSFRQCGDRLPTSSHRIGSQGSS